MTTFQKQKSSGFTLMEVMITVAILSILAVFAISNYRQYITKAHLQDGKSALQANRLFLETYYSKHNAYGRKEKINPNDPPTFTPLQMSDLPVQATGSGNTGYTLSIHPNCSETSTDGAGAATFCLIATPRPGQATSRGGGAECGVLSVDQTGKYAASKDPDNKFNCFK